MRGGDIPPANASGAGRIRAGDLERNVTFTEADPDTHAEMGNASALVTP